MHAGRETQGETTEERGRGAKSARPSQGCAASTREKATVERGMARAGGDLLGRGDHDV